MPAPLAEVTPTLSTAGTLRKPKGLSEIAAAGGSR